MVLILRNVAGCLLRGDIMCYYFFFQAEDGIRDLTVTGVQTCALPIYGQSFLGSPESFGMGHLSEGVRRTFYYLRADRRPPVRDDAAYDAWTKDRLYARDRKSVV